MLLGGWHLFSWAAFFFALVSASHSLTLRLESELVVDKDLLNPVCLAEVNATHFLVGEHYGRVRLLDVPNRRLGLVLDLRDRVLQPTEPTDERGLLGLALGPKGKFLYLSYSSKKHTVDSSNGDHQHIVSRMDIASDWKPDKNSEQILLNFSQPTRRHNGGHLFFGCDGDLFVAVGDGGHENTSSMFDRFSLLGKILRLRVNDDGGDEDRSALVEVFARGFRNPWRCSHDPAGDEGCRLFCGDVGRGPNEEEIVVVERGKVYGWMNDDPDSPCKDMKTTQCRKENLPKDVGFPIFGYKANASVVVGGFFYRGRRIAALRGLYVFADFREGSLHYLNESDDWAFGNIRVTPERKFHILSLEKDAIGNVYLLTTDNLKEPSGAIYHIVADVDDEKMPNVSSQHVRSSIIYIQLMFLILATTSL